MTRTALTALLAGIVAIGCIAAVNGPLAQAPFSSSAQTQAPTGGPFWTDDATSMMHRGAYAIAAARQWTEEAEAHRGPQRIDALREAETLLQRALDSRPNDASAWAMLGIVRTELGDVDGALTAMREAARSAPDAPQIASARLDLVSRLRRVVAESDLDQAKHDLEVLQGWKSGEILKRKLRQDRYLRLLAKRANTTAGD